MMRVRLSFSRLLRVAAYTILIECPAATMAFAQVAQDRRDDEGFVLVILLIAGVVYFIPTIIAFYRRHPNRWLIGVINTIFGGTGLGWLGSLIWALNAIHKSPNGSNGGESGLNLFANDPVKVEVTQILPPLQTQSSATDQLHKLKALHDQGVIDDDEFGRLKKPLLEALLK